MGLDTDNMTTEQIRQLIRAELDRLAAAEAPADLTDLVAKYEAKWPEICYVKGGSRARKAMEIVLRGGLHAAGNDARGNDLWIVGAHECSKKGGYCSCQDRVYVDPRYGKLCAHRLAVALKTNWLGDRNPQLQDLLKKLTPHGEFRLLVERIYDYHHQGQSVTVAGYLLAGQHEPVKFSPADRIEVTLPQFQSVLAELGLGLADLPEKLPGWSHYYYPLATDGLVPLNEATFYHKGRTWVMEEREIGRRLWLSELAAHLKESLSGPLPVKLSEYEARRVHELRLRLEANNEAARDVWAALPEALQVAILENRGVSYAH